MKINDFGGVTAPDLTSMKELAKYNSLRDKGISILFCTPTLDGQVSIDFTTSLIQSIDLLNKLGIPVIVGKSNNSCFIDLSRNLFAAQFMKCKCSHLWQVDSDMSWNPEAILDMLLKDKEFIAGIGRKKTDKEEYAGINYTDENGTILGETGETEEDVLIRMKMIGGAFTLHKRSVFDKLAKKFTSLKAMLGTTEGYSFYSCNYYKHAFCTEDYSFCALCEQAGIKIWCMPNIDMGHKGYTNYAGNHFKYLKGLKIPEIEKQYV